MRTAGAGRNRVMLVCGLKELVALRVTDDRQIARRQFHKPVRAMRRIGIKEQAIARFQQVMIVAMSVIDHAFEHVQQFEAVMLKRGKHIRGFRKGDKVWLDRDTRGVAAEMAKQVVLMPRAGAGSVDFNRIPGVPRGPRPVIFSYNGGPGSASFWPRPSQTHSPTSRQPRRSGATRTPARYRLRGSGSPTTMLWAEE